MGDYIQISTADSDFSVYGSIPAESPAPVVVVLEDLLGVNADIRQTRDELSADGFYAIVLIIPAPMSGC